MTTKAWLKTVGLMGFAWYALCAWCAWCVWFMKTPTQTLKHKRLYSIWVTHIQNIMDKVTQKVWDTIHGKWMRWIHKICRKQMRWREKFFWWKICENELGDNIPHTLCIPQPQPFYNFFPSPPSNAEAFQPGPSNDRNTGFHAEQGRSTGSQVHRVNIQRIGLKQIRRKCCKAELFKPKRVPIDYLLQFPRCILV